MKEYRNKWETFIWKVRLANAMVSQTLKKTPQTINCSGIGLSQFLGSAYCNRVVTINFNILFYPVELLHQMM